jgi:methylthioribose-1-phosphate isomerase
VDVFNPAFDVTPHRYVTAFITENGVIKPPFNVNIPKTFE